MGFFSKIFGTDYASQKQAAFSDIELSSNLNPEKTRPMKVSWLTMRGNNLAADHPKQAINDFREALQLEPDRISTMVSLGGAYSKTRKHDEAVAVLKKAENLLKPTDHFSYNVTRHNLYYILGSSYFFLGNKAEATLCLSKSLEAIEELRQLREINLMSDNDWIDIQKLCAPMIKNSKWLLERIKL